MSNPPQRVAACVLSALELPRSATDRRFHFICISRPAAVPGHAGLLDCRPLASSRRPLIPTIVLLLSMSALACNKNKPVVQPPPEVRTVTVEVPTIVRAIPPPELLVPLTPPLPVFISPFDPMATSALTAEGERLLRGMIEDLLQRIAAWKAWAEAK